MPDLMLLLLDNYDSFTYNLKDYFEQLGESVTVVKNDEVSTVDLFETDFDKLVLSPGPKTPHEAGNMMEIIAAFHTRVPILGVCLGHQALGQFFGASLSKAITPMHGKVSDIFHNSDGIYSGLNNPLKVCRYHSLILRHLEKTDLEITAQTAEKECMSFQHKGLQVTGIQYHPEAILTESGLMLLANWLKIISSNC
jgi:para-aminobenzoate synthetase component 2